MLFNTVHPLALPTNATSPVLCVAFARVLAHVVQAELFDVGLAHQLHKHVAFVLLLDKREFQ